ncbi:hypothetical protein, partial [Klebsiella oxytoca]|uniref:hypothetical protein n=1 Tax=Klebsiella oxytoca TaxID=571 RepID=UPI002ACDD0E8
AIQPNPQTARTRSPGKARRAPPPGKERRIILGAGAAGVIQLSTIPEAVLRTCPGYLSGIILRQNPGLRRAVP